MLIIWLGLPARCFHSWANICARGNANKPLLFSVLRGLGRTDSSITLFRTYRNIYHLVTSCPTWYSVGLSLAALPDSDRHIHTVSEACLLEPRWDWRWRRPMSINYYDSGRELLQFVRQCRCHSSSSREPKCGCIAISGMVNWWMRRRAPTGQVERGKQ